MMTTKFKKVHAETFINYYRTKLANAVSAGDEIAIETARKAQWHGLFLFLVGPGYELAKAAGIDTAVIAGEIDRINAKQCADMLQRPDDK